MKRLLICSLLVFAAFTANGQEERGAGPALSEVEGRREGLLVVSTASIFADMAETISGGLVEVVSVVPIGGDPHLYEPTPGDAGLVNRADLIIKNALTFEGWLNELIANSGTSAQVVTITDGVQPIQSDVYANSADPHAWMDANNGLIYIKNIYEALVELDPDNSDIYEFNYGIYKQQIEDLDTYIRKEIERIPEQRRILITSHDAFRYYGQAYGIQVEAVLGTSTDADVQVSDVQRLTNVIRESGVPAVFIESTVNPKLLKQLASDNGIIIGGSLYADSLGDEESPAPTYIEMLRFNTNTIVAALTGEIKISAVDEQDGAINIWLLVIIIALMAGSFIFMVNQLNASV